MDVHHRCGKGKKNKVLERVCFCAVCEGGCVLPSSDASARMGVQACMSPIMPFLSVYVYVCVCVPHYIGVHFRVCVQNTVG